MGDGSNINLWCDHWLSNLIERIPKPTRGVDTRVASKVADLRNEDGNGWNVELVKRLFSMETDNCILKVKWSAFTCVDKLMWQGLKAGGFSIGSYFELNTLGMVEGSNVVWIGRRFGKVTFMLI